MCEVRGPLGKEKRRIIYTNNPTIQITRTGAARSCASVCIVYRKTMEMDIDIRQKYMALCLKITKNNEALFFRKDETARRLLIFRLATGDVIAFRLA